MNMAIVKSREATLFHYPTDKPVAQFLEKMAQTYFPEQPHHRNVFISNMSRTIFLGNITDIQTIRRVVSAYLDGMAHGAELTEVKE